jgi:hypothetical protein
LVRQDVWVDSGVFIGVAAACFVLGLPWRRWQHVVSAVGLWALGLGIAVVGGVFHSTAQDNFLGAFVFTGLPTILWLAAFCLGMAAGGRMRTRRAASRLRHDAS